MAIKLQYWLIASIAANAALLGVVGGRLINPKPDFQPAETYERPGSRPVSAEIQAAWSGLPEADRRELGAQFKSVGQEMEAVSHRLQESAASIAEIARQEPFDKTKLEDTVVVYRHLQAGLQQRVDDTLVSHLGKMPPEARAAAARGLLTPYYAWMKPRGPSSTSAITPATGAGTPGPVQAPPSKPPASIQ